MMLNKTNLIGWSNLAFRMLLSFGLVFAVQHIYGSTYVKSWLIYITLIASIHASDGLISQYFVREILHAQEDPDNKTLIDCFKLQRRIYLGLAVSFSIVSIFSLNTELRYWLAPLIIVFCFLKMHA